MKTMYQAHVYRDAVEEIQVARATKCYVWLEIRGRCFGPDGFVIRQQSREYIFETRAEAVQCIAERLRNRVVEASSALGYRKTRLNNFVVAEGL